MTIHTTFGTVLALLAALLGVVTLFVPNSGRCRAAFAIVCCILIVTGFTAGL